MGSLDTRSAYLRSIELKRDKVENFDAYPFSIPAIHNLDTLAFDPHVTFFVGENGSGKSTLVEAIAVKAGFNAEGGSKNFHFSTRHSESTLHKVLSLARGTRRRATGYFLRAESYFNVATEIERLDEEPSTAPPVIDSYGGQSLHEQSHGESFMALIRNRFGPDGLYILDEPEAALSPRRQLALLAAMQDLVSEGCQFVVATHSPILLAYPGALLYELTETGIAKTSYEETEHYTITRDFLVNRERYLRDLFGPTKG